VPRCCSHHLQCLSHQERHKGQQKGPLLLLLLLSLPVVVVVLLAVVLLLWPCTQLLHHWVRHEG
jgi:hypothetical protein